MSSRPNPLNLDELEQQLDSEEFSLVGPASTTSTTRRSVRGESITPSSARAPSTRSSGGLEGDNVSGDATLWPVVLIGEGELDSLCFGVIGSGGSRFCIASKLADHDHCGIASHAKKKFVATADAYYGPGGRVNSRLTARKDPFVLKARVPRALQAKFALEADTISGWIHTLVDAQIPEPRAFDDPEDSVNFGSEGEKEKVDVESDISLLGMDDFDFDVDDVSIDLDVKHEALVADSDAKSWEPTMNAHRSAIDRLLNSVGVIGGKVPQVIRKLDGDYHRAVSAATSSIRDLEESRLHLNELIGDLGAIVADHGTLASAVQSALDDVVDAQGSSGQLQGDVAAAASAAKEAQLKWERSNDKVFRILTKLAQRHAQRCEGMEEKIAAIESNQADRFDMGGENSDPSPLDRTPEELIDDMLNGTTRVSSPGPRASTAPRMIRGSTDVSADTIFGQVEVGGTTMNLTMNTLFDMIRKIESKQDIQMDRSKSQGVIFRRLAFASEREFISWYVTLNPSGKGLAGFVDLITMWVYSSLEQVSTTDFLQMYHKSVSTGFAGNVETQFINALNNRYPTPFVGSTDVVLATQRIKAFESLDTWRGNGMGDGTKERLIEALRLGAARHRTYCEDNLPAGELREHAIRSGEFTMEFFQALIVHIDDEINMMMSFGLPEKQIMVLVSNQFVSICDELFLFHQHAINVDASNKAAAASRFAWVTLQALQKMGEYLRAKFRNHPAITGTRVRFLICQQADSSPSGLQAKFSALERKLSTLKDAASKESVSRIDNKLEDVIRANKLKKRGGGADE